MGRKGVVYEDIEKAANTLKNNGLNPTVDAVRAYLGTGSKSTIVPYLKRWRSMQSSPVCELNAEKIQLQKIIEDLKTALKHLLA